MVLIVPVNFRDVQALGCAAVAIATGAAALLTFSCTSVRSGRRKWMLIASIALTWQALLSQSAIVSLLCSLVWVAYVPLACGCAVALAIVRRGERKQLLSRRVAAALVL